MENERLKQKIMALSNAQKVVSANQPAKRKMVTPMSTTEPQPDFRKPGVADG